MILAAVLICSLLFARPELFLSASKEETNDVPLAERDSFLQVDGQDDRRRTPQNSAVKQEEYKWPGGVLPYEYDPYFPEIAKIAVEFGMERIEQLTCVRFREKNDSDDHYIYITSDKGCYSTVGRLLDTAEQNVSLTYGCWDTVTVIHELFHALGLFHEHTRPDRDYYVKIMYENVREGYETNFRKREDDEVNDQGIPYNYHSIMHYNAYTYSSNDKPTLVPLNDSIPVEVLGTSAYPTNLDLLHINTMYCDGVGVWTGWSAWSLCTCDGKTRNRTRDCLGGARCNGSDFESKTCKPPRSCPMNAEPTWTPWAAWTECTVSCGGGIRETTRECLSGNNCIGANTKLELCNEEECSATDAGSYNYSTWSSWSDCPCDGGMQNRTRSCIGGVDCEGPTTEQRLCKPGQSCLVVDPVGVWTPWSVWKNCSVPCGGGIMQMRRKCLNGSFCTGNYTKNESCNEEKCSNEYSQWTSWSACSMSCDLGVRVRKRKCINDSASCVGKNKELEDCNLGSCPATGKFSLWSTWSDCSVTCGEGVRIRQRVCMTGHSCTDKRNEVQHCRISDCPVGTAWSEWASWSECSVSCGLGVRERGRYCASRQSCLGTHREIQDCHLHPCHMPAVGDFPVIYISPPDNFFENISLGCSVGEVLPLLQCAGNSVLADNTTGMGEPFVNSTNYISWNSKNHSTFTIALQLAKPDRASRIDIYFYNNPSNHIGLPAVSKLEGSFDPSHTGALKPIHFTYSHNHQLSYGDDEVAMVSIIVTTDYEMEDIHQFNFLKLTFDFSMQFVQQAFVSEIVIHDDVVRVEIPLYVAFLAGADVVQLKPGGESIQLNCTVANDGAFTWTWVGPDERLFEAYHVYTADLTRTSILKLANPHVGMYTCIAHSKLVDGRSIRASTSMLLKYMEEICNPNPCQHGGRCESVGFHNYVCNCHSNFAGTDCSVCQDGFGLIGDACVACSERYCKTCTLEPDLCLECIEEFSLDLYNQCIPMHSPLHLGPVFLSAIVTAVAALAIVIVLLLVCCMLVYWLKRHRSQSAYGHLKETTVTEDLKMNQTSPPYKWSRLSSPVQQD